MPLRLSFEKASGEELALPALAVWPFTRFRAKGKGAYRIAPATTAAIRPLVMPTSTASLPDWT